MNFDEEISQPTEIIEQKTKVLTFIKLYLCNGFLLQTRNIRQSREL